jgi:hypothetical protein
MKKTLLSLGTVAAGMTAITASAVFTDYFAIEPSAKEYTIAPLASQVVGDTANATPWTVVNYGPNTAEWQRSPLLLTARATGFTMSLVPDGQGKVGMEILAPTVASAFSVPPSPVGLDPLNYCPWYYFNISIDALTAGGGGGKTRVWYTDARGDHDLVKFGDYGLIAIQGIDFQVNYQSNVVSYGIFMETEADAKLQTLQVTGWECVPEPSSIAMGVVVALGAGGTALRRYRSKKA